MHGHASRRLFGLRSWNGKEAKAWWTIGIVVLNVGKLYHSPFARAAKTAQIISAINRIPCVEESKLAEWRMQEETEVQVRRRMKVIFDQSLAEVAGMGSIGLVSHGGPIAVLLQELGIDPDELALYRTRFDTTNPLPPAAAWQVERKDARNSATRMRSCMS